MVKNNEAHVLLDVRAPVQFGICSLPGSLSIPLANLEKRISELKKDMEAKETDNGTDKLFWGNWYSLCVLTHCALYSLRGLPVG